MKWENMKNVEYKTLGELGEFIRGNGLKKTNLIDSGVGCIHYGQIYTYYGVHTEKTKSFVSENVANKLRKARKGDLIIATDTTAEAESVGKAVAWLGDEEIVIGGHSCIYRHELNPKFVSYFFETDDFKKQKRRYITGVTIKSIHGKDMSKIKIPVPSLEIQEQIVEILDKFDVLVYSISKGIPAEIAFRRQQYQHYRESLLTFDEI